MISFIVFALCLVFHSSFVDCLAVRHKEMIQESLNANPTKFYRIYKDNAVCVGISFEYIHSLGSLSAVLWIKAEETKLGLEVERDNGESFVSYVENDARCTSMGEVAILNDRTRIMCAWFRDVELPPYLEEGKVRVAPTSVLHYTLQFSDNHMTTGTLSIGESQSTAVIPYPSFLSSYCDQDWTKDRCSRCQDSCTYRLRHRGPRSCNNWFDPELKNDPRYQYMIDSIASTTTVGYDWREVASGVVSQDEEGGKKETILWWWIICAVGVFAAILVLVYLAFRGIKRDK